MSACEGVEVVGSAMLLLALCSCLRYAPACAHEHSLSQFFKFLVRLALSPPPPHSGGDAVIGCSGIAAPYSGGAGGGGRILLQYSAASTADTIISAAGGSCMCVGGGSGTTMDYVQQTLRLRSTASPISFIAGQFPQVR